MGLWNGKSVVEDFRDLLERERAALLEARFDVLERLVHEKERLTKALLKAVQDPAALEDLKRDAQRNEQLFSAMKEGLQSARARLDARRAATASLQTYDAQGRRVHLAQHSGQTPR